MKKNLTLIILLLLFSVALFPKGVLKFGPYVGYFSPTDEKLKQIYQEDVIYGLKLGIKVWKNFSIWISGKQYRKVSKTELLEDITTLTLNPIDLSLRYTIKFGSINPYIAAGYAYILYDEKSDIGDTKGEGKGYSAELGIEFNLSSHFHFDLGLQYTQSSVKPTVFDVQLGGLQAGLTLLVVF